MKTIVVSGKQAVGWPVSQADQAVLAAVARFHYLTAAQLGRLLYPGCHDDYRYARRRLARLADAGLLLRLPGLPTPRYGSTPHVFTLGWQCQPEADPGDGLNGTHRLSSITLSWALRPSVGCGRGPSGRSWCRSR